MNVNLDNAALVANHCTKQEYSNSSTNMDTINKQFDLKLVEI